MKLKIQYKSRTSMWAMEELNSLKNSISMMRESKIVGVGILERWVYRQSQNKVRQIFCCWALDLRECR